MNLILSNKILPQVCVCPDVSFGDFTLKHFPSCFLSTTASKFLSVSDKAACGLQDQEASSPPSHSCNVSTLPSYKQCEKEKWGYVIQDSKKIKQSKRAMQEITIFNRFDVLTVEDEKFNGPSSGSAEESRENVLSHSAQVFKGKKELREEIGVSDGFVRKKRMGEKRCAQIEELDGVFNKLPFSIVQKKQKGRIQEWSKIPEYISLKVFEHRNRYSLLENNQETDLVNLKKRLDEIKLIQEMKKSQLKKCHSCNAKKRTCLLDKSNCPALTQRCNFCNKVGHFPRSLCCKKFRKIKKSKSKHRINKTERSWKLDANISSSKEISPEILKKVNYLSQKKISQNLSLEIPFVSLLV